jgi:hypothetical protein
MLVAALDLRSIGVAGAVLIDYGSFIDKEYALE